MRIIFGRVKSNSDEGTKWGGTFGFLVSTSFRKWYVSRYIIGKIAESGIFAVYIQQKFLHWFLAISLTTLSPKARPRHPEGSHIPRSNLYLNLTYYSLYILLFYQVGLHSIRIDTHHCSWEVVFCFFHNSSFRTHYCSLQLVLTSMFFGRTANVTKTVLIVLKAGPKLYININEFYSISSGIQMTSSLCSSYSFLSQFAAQIIVLSL